LPKKYLKKKDEFVAQRRDVEKKKKAIECQGHRAREEKRKEKQKKRCDQSADFLTNGDRHKTKKGNGNPQ